jgi:hypothetical protein
MEGEEGGDFGLTLSNKMICDLSIYVAKCRWSGQHTSRAGKRQGRIPGLVCTGSRTGSGSSIRQREP